MAGGGRLVCGLHRIEKKQQRRSEERCEHEEKTALPYPRDRTTLPGNGKQAPDIELGGEKITPSEGEKGGSPP